MAESDSSGSSHDNIFELLDIEMFMRILAGLDQRELVRLCLVSRL